MEIIHIILGKANPNRTNGVNKVVNSLATYQTKKGIKISVWGITKNPIHDYPERNYETILFKETSKIFLPKGIKEEIQNMDKNTSLLHQVSKAPRTMWYLTPRSSRAINGC